mmetsp:Transcript_27270/g.76935  ORF Transcript_27270/g.76935 Transcript_27270/m.76935 type:complete len:1528 (+) Transcript_27270:290-4873(+)
MSGTPVQPRAVLCALVLLSAALPRVVAVESVVAPTAFRPGTPGAVLVLSPEAGVSYQARLTMTGSCGDSACPPPVTATAAAGAAGTQAVKLELQVPVDQKPGTYELTVSPAGSTKVLLSQKAEVKELKPIMMVETDKPGDTLFQSAAPAWLRTGHCLVKLFLKDVFRLPVCVCVCVLLTVYKPGSKILVRSICLLPSLKPCTDQQSVRLVLKNPDGDKVLAVDGVETETSGVFEGTLQLDSRSPLGDYVVTADGDNMAAELTVNVDEYVLPKFEVTLDIDQEYISPSTGALSGKVTAIYSYGKGVDGTVNLSLKRQLPWQCQQDQEELAEKGAAPRRAQTIVPKDCKPLVSEIKEGDMSEGAFTFELPLQKDSLSTWGSVDLEVSVTETATGEEASATSSVELRGDPYLSVELKGPEVFYPGLHADFEVTSEMSDGKPVDGDYLVTIEFETFLPRNWQPPGGDFEKPGRVVTSSVSTVGGKGVARILMPPQPACCLEAAAAAGSEFDWDKTNGCCWSTINPSLKKVNSNGKVEDDRIWGSDCIEPAFPPTATYVSLERAADSPRDTASDLAFTVTATGDITSRPVLYIVTADGVFVSSSPVSWQSVAYDSETGTSAGEFMLPRTKEMIPEAHVVVAFAGDDGSLAAAEVVVKLDTQDDLKLLSSRPLNINAEPSTPSGRDYYEPGEEVLVSLEAEPSSVVFVGGVDRAVSYLSNDDTRITSARLLQAFKAQMGMQDQPPPPGPMPPCAAWRALDQAGLKIAAPAGHPDICLFMQDKQRPQGGDASGPVCYWWGGRFDDGIIPFAMGAIPEMAAADMAGGAAGSNVKNARPVADPMPPGEQIPVKVRTKFPETWIWRSATVDSSTGAFSFVSPAPDSITTWDISGFSLSSTAGLGLSPAGEPAVRVFKPLFVDLKLPYKVVRGETLQVVGSVFNYQAEAMEVQVVLSVPEGGMPVDIPKAYQRQLLQVEANGAASFRVNLDFPELGTAKLQLQAGTASGEGDAVVRTLKVVPEGLRQQSSLNVMLEPPEGGIQQETIPVQVDDVLNLVAGSEYATLTLAGELLGPSISGLGSLVQLPMGCGEQNMLLMAPTVYVMRYLNARQEARPELRQKALEYIQVGYSRELQYKHPDGSFSAFGTSDDSGSTWLTAFVLKVFSQAHGAQLVEVAEDIAHTAAKWLVETSQATSGQFQPKGRVIHSEMVGGVTEDTASVSLTAFVTSALLEAHKAGLLPAAAEDGLSKALGYLVSAPRDTNYAKVLVAHTLSMAAAVADSLPSLPALPEAAEAAFADLQAIAVKEGTMTHWAPKEQASSGDDNAVGSGCSNCYVAHAGGPEVEMTGYAMSAMLIALGEDALTDGFAVAKWLLSERSPTGGWRSTQDTVVALEGLSGYAALSSASPPDMTITVRFQQPEVAGTSRRRRLSEAVEKQLTLDAGNYDVLQVLELPVGQEVEITVQGSGKAIMTVGTVWHTKALPSEPTFTVCAHLLAPPRQAPSPAFPFPPDLCLSLLDCQLACTSDARAHKLLGANLL